MTPLGSRCATSVLLRGGVAATPAAAAMSVVRGGGVHGGVRGGGVCGVDGGALSGLRAEEALAAVAAAAPGRTPIIESVLSPSTKSTRSPS